MPVEYAHALFRSLESVKDKREAENRVEELVNVLTKEGKTRALPAILREFERLQARKSSQKPTLTIAKDTDSQQASLELQARIPSLPEIELKTDERLIGGWRYTDSDTLIDSSYKTALLELYRRVTTL